MHRKRKTDCSISRLNSNKRRRPCRVHNKTQQQSHTGHNEWKYCCRMNLQLYTRTCTWIWYIWSWNTYNFIKLWAGRINSELRWAQYFTSIVVNYPLFAVLHTQTIYVANFNEAKTPSKQKYKVTFKLCITVQRYGVFSKKISVCLRFIKVWNKWEALKL